MTLTLADVLTRAPLLVQDHAPTLDVTPDKQEAIRQALAQYSIDAPRSIVADLTGDGSTYDFDAPADYIDGESRIEAIEYPAGEQSPVYLNPARYGIYRTSAATKIRFVDLTPATGETARVTFTAPHTLDGLDGADETTIPSRHDEAFVTLAAAQMMFLLAARFLHEQENTIGADTVDRRSKSEEASRQARALLSSYRTMARVSARGPAALARVQWTSAYAPGVGRLTHGRRG